MAKKPWHGTMPFMFERIADDTKLLQPNDVLSDYSIVADIRNGMSEEDYRQEGKQHNRRSWGIFIGRQFLQPSIFYR